MDALTDILTSFPNCRVTIRSGPVRRKPYEGQLRILARKGRQIRMQDRYYWPDGRFSYASHRGRPRYHWVSESDLSPADRDLYRRIRQDKGDPL